MIRYALKCAEGHGFESWFQSAAAYDKLVEANMVACTQCGSTQVEKALMAPRVSPGRKAAIPAEAEPSPSDRPAVTPAVPVPQAPQQAAPLSAPASDLEKAITELKKQVEANSDYVGKDFVKQARQGILDIFSKYGAAHFQIGRTYPYAENMSPETKAVSTNGFAMLDSCSRSSTTIRSNIDRLSANHGVARSVMVTNAPGFNQRASRKGLS